MDLSFDLSVTETALAKVPAVTGITERTRPFGFRTRFVDLERPSIEIFFVQGGDGLLGFLIVGHLDETETSGTSCLPIHDDRGVLNLAILSENFLEFSAIDLIRKVTYINIHCIRLRHEKNVVLDPILRRPKDVTKRKSRAADTSVIIAILKKKVKLKLK
jgi:hypothetical protein